MGFGGFYGIWISPSIAYRFTPEGLYLGQQTAPAFHWDQVRGATLNRGKRRTGVTLVFYDRATINTAGLLPSWLAGFLGRPTDQDMALTNMDTSMALTPFLDLIQNHLDTYGQINLTNLANNPMNNQTNNLAKKEI